MQRFRLGGERISEDLFAEAEKLMDCKPAAIAVVLTTDAAPGGVDKLAARSLELQTAVGVPVLNASAADHAALRALGARRVAVVTPFDAEVDQRVRANVEAAGFEVVAIGGTEAPSLPAICETPLDDVRRVFRIVAESDCEAILQVGTALPVVAMIAELEAEIGKPIVACNAAVYWQALRAVGITDRTRGFGRLLEEH
jgi:maleate isomerase